MKIFNKEAFIAYNGKVYDVTRSNRWVEGNHEDMHDAGKDLTIELETMSPHGPDAIYRFAVIGTLEEN